MNDCVNKIKERFGNRLNVFEKSAKRIYIDVKPEDWTEVAGFIFNDLYARYQIMTGTDTKDAVEVLLHFAFDKDGMVVSLRTLVKKPGCEIDSVANMITGAEWIEREIMEILGVKFRNHPNPKHLLLTEDWDGKYPFRKDNV